MLPNMFVTGFFEQNKKLETWEKVCSLFSAAYLPNLEKKVCLLCAHEKSFVRALE